MARAQGTLCRSSCKAKDLAGKEDGRDCDFPEAWGCPGSSFAGISRSTTIVIAYVMTVTGLGWQEVLEAIKASRPIANPNPGFRQQLEEFGWANSQKVGAVSFWSQTHDPPSSDSQALGLNLAWLFRF